MRSNGLAMQNNNFMVFAKTQVLVNGGIQNLLQIGLEMGQLSLPVDEECYRKIGVGDTISFQVQLIEKYTAETRVVPN